MRIIEKRNNATQMQNVFFQLPIEVNVHDILKKHGKILEPKGRSEKFVTKTPERKGSDMAADGFMGTGLKAFRKSMVENTVIHTTGNDKHRAIPLRLTLSDTNDFITQELARCRLQHNQRAFAVIRSLMRSRIRASTSSSDADLSKEIYGSGRIIDRRRKTTIRKWRKTGDGDTNERVDVLRKQNALKVVFQQNMKLHVREHHYENAQAPAIGS
ncbi:hypothetical protein BC829DRAFT_416200 [Chytridium lagenaria]|nr:hypothetical protein BC829DRAFT_416200 [Chytridium lagenaria]